MSAERRAREGASGPGQGRSAMPLQEILQYLKEHGEQLDADIAVGTGVSLVDVGLCLARLAERGDVILCRTTRYADGHKIEGTLCRVSGYSPPVGPGRKAKAQIP